ncbi:GNAT family N-acetyltransferase [Paramaledivibacter caminithermalis]|jgi:putative acetyltransferase|uniref:Ribosomal protein S18 acetylase RimI n=1 Tax=Paramaledivibacter caminithermalis (strain DSM 15212 / CIP 107654 / DViRD3) TaxID=1121301 RepID=A0A1M6QG03_PARC5|nr:GNAT family N-acetyltransferase [Paramaledivibacter caminithermalis]SHK19179.1 Ribosomal protein S18 acetylase RimI [Paramaledivibacter caminithermalis DSM 15212]
MCKEIRINVFEIKDYDNVYKLWEEIFPDSTDSSYSKEQIELFLSRNPGASFFAEIDGKVVGAVLAGYDGRRGYIHHLGVLESYRRKNIGKMLMDKAEEALRNAGMNKVHLFVFKDNINAKAFYNNIGFKQRYDLDMFSKALK